MSWSSATARLSGEISEKEFDSWVEDIRVTAYAYGESVGYRSGYDDGQRDGLDAGYKSCQENYGDGPSQ